ncbi:MAG: hypothetical protein O7E49_10750 [Gemmatimonadetes bacterium]|nr:hypothetical protein [Gemmatimonadota bacterium]
MIRPAALAPILAIGLLATTAGVAEAQSKFGFEATVGYANTGGGYGALMDDAIPAEAIITYGTGNLKVGFVGNVASFTLVPTYDGQTWWKVGFAGSVTWFYSTSSKFRPFVHARAGIINLKPEGAGFGRVGDSFPSIDRIFGWEGGVAAGAELWVTPKFGFTASGLFSSYNTNDADLSDVGLEPISSGSGVGFRFGFVFRP